MNAQTTTLKSIVPDGGLLKKVLKSASLAVNWFLNDFPKDGTIRLKFKNQKGTITASARIFTVSCSEPLGPIFDKVCRMFRVVRNRTVFVYHGIQLRSASITPVSLGMAKSADIFALPLEIWRNRMRSDARRGLLTSTKSQQEMVKSYKKVHCRHRIAVNILVSPRVCHYTYGRAYRKWGWVWCFLYSFFFL